MEILDLVRKTSGAKDKKGAIWAKVTMPGKKKLSQYFFF